MKRWILSLIVLFSLPAWLPLSAQQQHYMDSVQNAVQGMDEPQQRLTFLLEEVETHLYPPYDEPLAELFHKEAEQQKNNEYIYLGLYYMGRQLTGFEQLDSLNRLVDRMHQLAPLVGNYNYYLLMKARLGRMYAKHQRFESAHHLLKGLLAESSALRSRDAKVEALSSEGYVYLMQQRYAQAEEMLTKAYATATEQAEKRKFNQFVNPQTLIDMLSRLCTLYNSTSRRKLTGTYLQDIERLLTDEIKRTPDFYLNHLGDYVDCYQQQANYYMAQQEYGKAQRLLDKANEMILQHKLDEKFWLNQNLTQMQLHVQLNHDMAALASIDTILPLVKREYPNLLFTLAQSKSWILYRLNRLEEAIAQRKELIQMYDSINNSASTEELEEIRQIYGVDELEQEYTRLELSSNEQQTLAVFGLLAIIVCCFFCIQRLSNRISRSERQAHEENERTELHNAQKEVLRKSISHDVRTPLNSVVGFSDLLTMEDLDAETRHEYGALIQERAEMLMDYLTEVLVLSRLESGKSKYEKQPCDIVALFREVTDRQNELNRGLITTEVCNNCNTPQVWVNLDVERFKEMLSRMMQPVMDEQESYHIVLKLRKKKEGLLQVDVVNTPLARERFEARSTLIRHEINTHFVETHGGTYRVEPNNPDGPTIRFTLEINPKSGGVNTWLSKK